MTTQAADWDLVVIGGGTAGLVGAKTAAALGARVLLLEENRTGGDCLWTGCVPSKALIAAASAAAGVRRAEKLGIHAGRVSVDFASVRAHITSAIAAIAPADSIEALERAGVTVCVGHARFTGPDSLTLTEQSPRAAEESHTFAHALITTGASPTVPPIPGLTERPFLTSETVWGLTELPEHLVVIGGGSVGCELGQAFARLGSQVTLVEQAAHLLPLEDPAAGRIIEETMESAGVRVMVGQRPAEATTSGVRLPGGEELHCDTLLVAVGRTPRTAELALDLAGVKLDERGFVRVDHHLCTTNPSIWAAGDVTGHPQFTHVAGAHGALAAGNALLGVRRKADPKNIPRVTFTQPEVAAVGMPTAQLPKGHQLLTWDHTHLDRAITDGEVAGFTHLLVNKRGRLTGATVVGPRAGETIGEIALAVEHQLTMRDLAATIHAYPTYNDAVWNLATRDYFDSLNKPAVQALLRVWQRVRGVLKSPHGWPRAR